MYCCFNQLEFIWVREILYNNNSNQNVVYLRYKMNINKFNFRIIYFNINMKENLKVN